VGLGRALLWLNVFVIPTLVVCAVAGVYVGIVAGVVNFLNAWYADRKIRPALERLERVINKILKSWE
jgi:hypothetical protein